MRKFNRMVEEEPEHLDRVFYALSDPTRRAMLRQLTDKARSVTELAEPFKNRMSLAAASKHIKVLESAHLIHRSVQGRVHLCRLNAAPLQDVEAWMKLYERFWTDRLDALEEMLETDGDHERDERD
jgi:DNA-binding transcriptional ArsR family regulator